MSIYLDQFVNKRVTFRFYRQELQFDLSQSLFSSFDVDAGTRLLLKTIAKEVDLTAVRSVLDVGCGVGVIGLSLKKAQLDLALTVQDRNALALAFTQRNARLNKLAPVDVPGGLGLHGLNGRRFDLIVSNLPGKAGEPVLADMTARMTQFLTKIGRAAVVIVYPLADMLRQTIQKQGGTILHEERSKGHMVFHFSGGASPSAANPLAVYLRGKHTFQAAGTSYKLHTAYNVPEFDTLGFHTGLAFEMMKGRQVNGRVLVWNPGQGHMPVYLHQHYRAPIDKYTLGSRDLLSLMVSQTNLLAHDVKKERVTAVHAPTLHDITGPFDFITLFPDDDPGVPWHTQLPEQLRQLLAPDGSALLVAKSNVIQRLLSTKIQFIIKGDKKRRGYRALLLKNKT